jgi:sugar lactone lactonase YvrE
MLSRICGADQEQDFLSNCPAQRELIPSARSKLSKIRTTLFLALALMSSADFSALTAHAQTAQFVAAQSIIPSTGLSYPYRVAVDGSGSVYISDTQANSVLKETLAPDGTYTESVVASTGLATPYGVAVDAGGHVYIADNGNNRVLIETPSVGGYVQTVMSTSTLSYPTGIAADSAGNVYIADTGNGRILKETPSAGSFTETVVSSSGLPQIVGIAVDSSGNVFVSDIDNMAIYEETLVAGSYVQTTVSTSGLNYPYDVAVDTNDNLYISDFSNYRIVEEMLSGSTYTQGVYPTYNLAGALGLAIDKKNNIFIADTFAFNIKKSSPRAGNFGPIPVGTQSPVAYLIFGFTATGGATLTLGGTAVSTQGATGLDFADSESGNCSTSAAYANGNYCVIGVTLTPGAPGQRLGGAALLDINSNVLAAGYITGNGTGPLANFPTGTETVVASSPSISPWGVTVDASGNIYSTEPQNGSVIMITSQGVPSVIASGLSNPQEVAVDGIGNVYISEAALNRVLKETPSGSGYVQTIVASTGLSAPTGVAVDAGGNVYIADSGNSRLLKETLTAIGYTESVIPTSSLNIPYAIAVDASGNVYIADSSNNRVLMESPTSGSYVETTVGSNLSGPTGVSVDANGNVYIADSGNARILKETLSAGTYAQTAVLTGSPTSPAGVAVGANGNVYVADLSLSRILLEDFVDPPSLTFAATKVGSTSADSPQIFSMFNFGNSALTFQVPGSGSNPSFSTSNFVTDSSTTCPVLSPSSSPMNLSINASCSYAVNFTPTTAGSLTDALIISDSSLNVLFASQTIALTGTGIQPLATTLTLTANPPSPVDIQQTETLTATLSPYSSGGHLASGETVHFLENGNAVGTASLNASGVATLAGVPVVAGANSFTSSFSGDSYFAASTSSAVSVTSQQLTPVITWATPAEITFGITLSAAQLNATTPVPGAFVYTPAGGTTPAAGTDTLSVTFTPTDTTNYTNATAAVMLSVSDFSFASSGGTASQSVSVGSPATFTFTSAPLGLSTILGVTSFSVTGMPAGATYVFTPSSFPTNSAGGPVSLVVQTTGVAAGLNRDRFTLDNGHPGIFSTAMLALLCMPVLGLFWLRKKPLQTSSALAVALFTVLLVGVVLGIVSCSNNSQSTTPQSASYPLVVTATSGSLQHSVNATLTVQN